MCAASSVLQYGHVSTQSVRRAAPGCLHLAALQQRGGGKQDGGNQLHYIQ